MYKLLVLFEFCEPGNTTVALTSQVIECATREEAEAAKRAIKNAYPHNAVYANVTQLYA